MSEMTITPDLYFEGDSKQWKNRQAIYLDIKTCEDCRQKRGKIYNFSAKLYQPEHLYCRCSVIPMYSNDGLVFVTEDHYQTFYEITR